MKRLFFIGILSLGVLSFFILTQGFVDDERAKPNIIIIFTDDQGYNDLGCFGSPDILTPHIDELATSGTIFRNFYTAQPVCTASRVSLLTGCYPNRLGLHGALGPDSQVGINPNETTLAEMLKSSGYATGIFGKWHLGSGRKFNPLNHGFDEFYGIPYSNDMWPNHPWQGSVFNFPPLPLFDNFDIIDTLTDQTLLTSQITERAVQFIQEHKEEPFFLYVPHPQPHVPLFVSEKFKGKSDRGIYGDVIMEIDWSVGQINQALKDNKLDDNTWIIFTSDNGPWLSYGTHAGSSHPLREGKGTNWDGGTKVPCVMKFPGYMEEGQTISTPVMTIDLFPTIAHLIGAELPERKIDGLDVWPLLTGQTETNPHDAYYFYYHQNELQAVRSGDFKLVLPHKYRTLHGRIGRDDGMPIDYEHETILEAELYHVSDDPGELYNVSGQYADEFARLMHLANEMKMELGDSRSGIEGRANRSPGRL